MAKTISKSDLVQLLASTNAEEITVKQFGECKMKKTDNPFFHKVGRSWVPDHTVEKETVNTYDFGGASYEERVNEALEADGSTGTFKGGSLSWGEFVKGAEGRVIEYNGEFYVRCYVKNDLKPQVRYFVDKVAATAEQVKTIKDFMSEKSGSTKQANEGLSEDKQVIPNNIKFSNIVTIEVDGVEYEIA